MSNVQMKQLGGRNTEDKDDSSDCKCICDCVIVACKLIVACVLIVYEIYDIVSDSMTTHKYGQGELSIRYNKFVFQTSLAFTIIGSLFAVPKIILSGMDIAIGCCGVTEEMPKKKADRIVNFLVLLLEALPQAVIAEFFLDVCPAQKFHIQWLFISFAVCTIVPFCSSMYSFVSYLCKHREEGWKMNVMCVVGIVLAITTCGFAMAAIVRDIQSMCRAAKKVIKPT